MTDRILPHSLTPFPEKAREIDVPFAADNALSLSFESVPSRDFESRPFEWIAQGRLRWFWMLPLSACLVTLLSDGSIDMWIKGTRTATLLS